jgi:hypothetical protein
LDLGYVCRTPAIGIDGSINFASSWWIFSSMSQNGSNKWEFNTEGKFMQSKPAIGPDNTVYVTTRTNLFAINSDGTQKWIYSDSLNLESAPAIGKDGEIYLTVSQFGDPFVELLLRYRLRIELNPDGTKKWLFGDGNDSFSPRRLPLTGQSTSAPFQILRAEPDGGVKWTFHRGAGYYSSPALVRMD